MIATPSTSQTSPSTSRAAFLKGRYDEIRRATARLCVGLEAEDYVIQSMPDCSPAKWHLAHTTWFFETFILKEADPGYQPFHPQFAYLFNSYYVQAGERWQRSQRGLLSRPTVREIYEYRDHVDRAMEEFFESGISARMEEDSARLLTRVEIGLQHEQQHQELLVTDLKNLFSLNPLRPALKMDITAAPSQGVAVLGWVKFDEAVRKIGYDGDGFFYDNEKPLHHELVPAFELATRTITCGEYMEFMEDAGYSRPELWLSLGWAAVEENGWTAPLYWEQEPDGEPGQWQMFTATGMRAVDPSEPVTHISFFEADAYARWRGCDLPTEAMWESACLQSENTPESGHFVEDGDLHPVAAVATGGLDQMFGNVWEWTASPYVAYPGHRAPSGALGEYNGKFMCNQMVLRGGSCVTPRSHIRATYRNFFPPESRWQFSGIRLAKVISL